MALRNWYTQAFPPKPTFTEADVPSQKGRVVIVTGGNVGVGFELCAMMYAAGATVYMASRSQARAERAIEDIISTSRQTRQQGSLRFLHLDLSDLQSVMKAAETFAKQESRLDVLWNHAGIGPLTVPQGAKTAQGVEIMLGTHCVAPLLFTQCLLSHLRAAAKSSRPGATRVVWTSSWLAEHWTPVGGVDMDKLDGTGDMVRNYAVSKAGNWILAVEMARRYPDDGILSVVQNPGNLKTKVYGGTNWLISGFLNLFLLHAPKMGAYTELYAGLSPELTLDDHQGEYIAPWGHIYRDTVRHDILRAIRPVAMGGGGLGKRFWDWCEQQWKGAV
ncbi:NAD(P)-binding protein [Thozetella sp. PMI_491]|nr:NAD(P)-binding protein [Thozetella sp. PMI_491]